MAPVLDRQRQLITPRQASEVGVHRATIRRMVVTGALDEIEPRVYGVAGAPVTWERRLLAVLLSLGAPAVASHRSAARLLAIPTYEGAPMEISVPSKRGFSHRDVIVHESRDLVYLPAVTIDGVPCTPARRMAVDIGAVLGPTAYATVIRELRRDHGVTWKQLAAVLQLHSRRGRNGCGPLRRQLERYYGIEGIPETTLEQGVLDLLIDAGMRPPVCQHRITVPGVPPFRIDLAYVDEKLAIEVDGPHHDLPEIDAYDRWRQAILEALGWEVLRFREEDIAYRPWIVAHRVAQALARRTA